MSHTNNTIVYFHTGRGGRFYNAGFRTFNGTKNIDDVLTQSSRWSFIQNRTSNGRFCKPFYADSNGNFLISCEEAATGVGKLNWDNDYDTDTCIFLRDCDESDLKLIANSNEWNNTDLIEEYFNDCTDLVIDWKKFDGNYENLIYEYFNFPSVDIDDFYKEEEN